MIILLSLLAPQRDSLLVVSWNVENFLDYRVDTTGRHTAGRFYSKCNAVAKTLLLIGEREGRLPDAVALMEVGDRFVVERLLQSTVLRKLDYGIVHFDSPDRRGIDCALLYRRSRMQLERAFPAHLYDSTGAVMPTRDILVAEFDSLAILVNHHPSKVGVGSGSRRRVAMQRMTELMDSLAGGPVGHGRTEAGSHSRLDLGSAIPPEGAPLWRRSEKRGSTCATVKCRINICGAGPGTFFGPAPFAPRAVLSVGDFNEDLWHDGSPGTIKYNGAWEKIDGHFARGLTVRESVFADPALSEPDRSWGGTKPRRAFVGPRWNGGISDHYPIILWVTR